MTVHFRTQRRKLLDMSILYDRLCCPPGNLLAHLAYSSLSPIMQGDIWICSLARERQQRLHLMWLKNDFIYHYEHKIKGKTKMRGEGVGC